MTDADPNAVILIAPVLEIKTAGRSAGAFSSRIKGYSASYPGQSSTTGNTMADALKPMLETVDVMLSAQSLGAQVKVRRGTKVTSEDLVNLLRLLDDATILDLSGCDLGTIDLSPEALDRLNCPQRARAYKRGIKLVEVRLTEAYLGSANLQCAELANAQLQGANLASAKLQWADLSGADLRSSNLEKAQLQNAIVADAELTNAKLSGACLQHADLQNANLQDADLSHADLQGADLRRADLRELDLREAESLEEIIWHNARLEKTWLYRRQIEPLMDELAAINGVKEGSYRSATETYLALKANFSSLGDYENAAWAYVKEQQMEKASFFPTTAGKHWLARELRRAGDETASRWWSWWPRSLRDGLRSAGLHARLFLGFATQDTEQTTRYDLDRPRWVRNWLFELLTGYGERPQRPVLWGLITIVVFAAVLALAGNVGEAPPVNSPEELAGTHNVVTALTHSVAAFATGGFSTPEPVGWGARLLTGVESMLGVGSLALFIFTIGNRMSRS